MLPGILEATPEDYAAVYNDAFQGKTETELQTKIPLRKRPKRKHTKKRQSRKNRHKKSKAADQQK